MDSGTLTAASAGAIISRLICHPIDTITVHKQTIGHFSFKTMPLKAYYKGLPASLALVTPATCIYLSTYCYTKEKLLKKKIHGTLLYSLCGISAEVISSVMWTPLEVVKARTQIAASGSGVLRVVRDLYKTEGLRGFYRGYWMGIAIYLPTTVSWWVVYEHSKSYLMNLTHWDVSVVAPICSALGTVVATVISTPLDIVKTNFQVATTSAMKAQANSPALVQPALTIRSIASSILKKYGLRGFVRGLLTRMCYVMPSGMISMSIFESLKPDIQLV
ncbi:iron ion transporter [Schizosaccharomyces japonicus yFS275]|uniref:Iron ion transporter n=1 Tax=Schizosaccharomyces japonicus (strain yFS275 / FY16936) TaxID=402676 RepID=B6K7M1_SCHJY|nr:iron ion transporter [Schizosaccharomyces japonicus yFS275]EEB09525.1 iron ion transporter [Schizosaccharomyces japonicus yFS275]